LFLVAASVGSVALVLQLLAVWKAPLRITVLIIASTFSTLTAPSRYCQVTTAFLALSTLSLAVVERVGQEMSPAVVAGVDIVQVLLLNLAVVATQLSLQLTCLQIRRL
jgi:hypothetical protein